MSGEEHYNIISALHKSMRGSDDNAALYWLARMLEGGEDPLYIARRLVRFASEDVGERCIPYGPMLHKYLVYLNVAMMNFFTFPFFACSTSCHMFMLCMLML